MYPVWEGLGVHSAMFVAIVAVFHVVASHLTVGAAWFNLYVERRAVREDRPELYAYVRRSAKGLLVFAYVFGAMAGVGIWQATTAANPRGISTLIHNFVLFWGSEWYMFMIDVVGIIVYYYTLGKVDRRTHLRLAWILALGGTGTLSLIVGILGFKATPGVWIQTGNPLDGFFNPTFWPQFFLRLFLMIGITGVWAILIAGGMRRDYPERSHIIRWAGLIGMGGFAAALVVGRAWYLPRLFAQAGAVLSSKAVPGITVPTVVGGLTLVSLFLAFAAWKPSLQTKVGTLGIFIVVFAALFAAERTREVARKPDIISGYMSSNQLLFNGLPARGIASEEALVNENGVVGTLPFVIVPEQGTVSDEERLFDQGRAIALQECSSCHSVSDQTVIKVGDSQIALRQQSRLLKKISTTDVKSIEFLLGNLQSYSYMHAFVGTTEDKHALATYLATMVERQQGVPAQSATAAGTPSTLLPRFTTNDVANVVDMRRTRS